MVNWNQPGILLEEVRFFKKIVHPTPNCRITDPDHIKTEGIFKACILGVQSCKLNVMQLTVPFIPDEKYIKFLGSHATILSSVYFPLYSGPVLDARMRFDKITRQTLVKRLSQLKNTPKYCLLNTRFIHPKLYQDKAFLTGLFTMLEKLTSESGLTGIVLNDFYFLNALSVSGPQFLGSLEAVPGINSMIDSISKIEAVLDIIEPSGFKLPGKLILDRSLNRHLKRLEQIRHSLKSNYPEIKIELLANEGCIYQCPFKLSHDAQIAYSNIEPGKNRTHTINTRVGCHAFFHNTPDRIFKSPFIRPEDIGFYENLADSVKICGRTLGTYFLTTAIKAYETHSFDGNLATLMDASHWLSDVYHIDNKSLDPGFFNLITNCTKACKTCRICSDLFERAATRKKVTIRPYKDFL